MARVLPLAGALLVPRSKRSLQGKLHVGSRLDGTLLPSASTDLFLKRLMYNIWAVTSRVLGGRSHSLLFVSRVPCVNARARHEWPTRLSHTLRAQRFVLGELVESC